MRFFWEQERDHCLLGLTVDNPVVIEELPKVRPRLAPELGENTEEVLDELGFDAAQIDALRAKRQAVNQANGAVSLIYIGAAVRAVADVSLGIGLLRAA